jgi:hypothetical protein
VNTSQPPSEERNPDERGADDGVDVTLIRWALSLTPAERLKALQGFVDSVFEIRERNNQT